MVFRPKSMGVEWITAAFRTTIPELPELRRISIRVPYNLATYSIKRTNASVYGGWLDLDRLLVQLWESCYTRPKVICTALCGEERDMRDFVEYLLPELTKRGMLRIVKSGGRFKPVSAEFGHRNPIATIT